MDKLADNLQRLGEDDLLTVVQLIHDKKTAETMTKNDVERKPTLSLASLPPIHLSTSNAICTSETHAGARATFANIGDAEGEFHVDLYTLPDTLIRELWDYAQEKLGR